MENKDDKDKKGIEDPSVNPFDPVKSELFKIAEQKISEFKTVNLQLEYFENHLNPYSNPLPIDMKPLTYLELKAIGDKQTAESYKDEIDKYFASNPDKERQTEKIVSFINSQYYKISNSIDRLLERFELLKNDAKIKAISNSLFDDFIVSNDLNILLNIFGKVQDEGQRYKIFQAICKIYDSRLSHLILNALKDANGNIRALAVKMLEKLQNIDLVTLLTIALNDPESVVRIEAENAVEKIKDLPALLNFHAKTGNKNQKSRLIIFQKLCENYNSQLAYVILNALEDENPTIRAFAVKNLEKVNPENYFDLLISALKDHESNVRIEAVLLLKKLKDKRAIDHLSVAFDEKRYSDLNRNILYTLISLGFKPDISAYIEDLNNSYYMLRRDAAGLIIEIAKLDFTLVREQWNVLVTKIEKPNIDHNDGKSDSWSSDCGGHSDYRVHRDSPGIGISIPVELRAKR